ncbi:hypothetical protein QCA50_010149 [Cerrena zonata]|uniref:Uncharacterized protein n=1 Tax=Cerrena zonata TaxID=2478898 RepID=A0AAW0G4D7_9APHY
MLISNPGMTFTLRSNSVDWPPPKSQSMLFHGNLLSEARVDSGWQSKLKSNGQPHLLPNTLQSHFLNTMQFSKLNIFRSKKTKQAGPLVFELAPHHWVKTPLPSGSTDSLPSPGTSSRTRSEEDLTLHEYQLFTARAHYKATDPIDDEDRQLGHKHHMFLIPLDMAARLDVIKYRMEGFEMQEHRDHILEVIRGD